MKKNKKGREAFLREATVRVADLERKLAAQKEKAEQVDKLTYELGRYKRAVATRNTVIAQLQGDLKLAEIREQANEGLVAILLSRLGATDKEYAQKVGHLEVQEAQHRLHVMVTLPEDDPETAVWLLHVSEEEPGA